MKNLHRCRMVGDGPEALGEIVQLLVERRYSTVSSFGERDATERDPLDWDADIAKHEGVKVFQIGTGDKLPVALSTDAVVAMAQSWLAGLTLDHYPKGKGYHDSYKQGWLVDVGWRGDIELFPVWIGISK